MLSPPFSPVPALKAPKRSPRRQPTRTGASKKVYGKRKVDAPRAVLDHGSPFRPTTTIEAKAVEEVKAVNTWLDDVREKLAAVKIEESSVQERGADNAEKEKGKEKEKQKEEESAAGDSLREEEKPIVHVTPTSTPTKETNHETLQEVKIPTTVESDAAIKQPEEGSTKSTESERRRTRKQKKPAPRLSSGCVQDEKTNAYARPILDESMSPVASQGVQKFSSWAARAGNMFEVVKIAEGSYGEVYKLRLWEEVCRGEISKSKLAKLRAYGDGVFKIVPLRAQSGPGSKKFTSVEEIVAEVKLLKLLDPIPGFARFREVHVVQGRFPESFQAAWMKYKRTKDDCLNPNPANKKAYPDSQLWAILEMDDAGCELEKFSWSSIFQVYDIFWGVAMALAKAEEYAMFEHRDLHLGNICLRSTRPDGSMDPPTSFTAKELESSSGFGLSSLETTIIDYSLSRAELRLDDNPDEKPEIACSDLDKKQLFDAIGRDEDEILLRDTYRYMRAQVYKGNPLDVEKTPDIPGIWAEYTPKTNLIWLLFLLKNLLKRKKPEPEHQPPPPTAAREPLTPRPANKNIKKRPTKSSKPDLVKKAVNVAADPNADAENKENHCDKQQQEQQQQQEQLLQEKVAALKKTLSDRLQKVLELLDLKDGHEDMCCAADLVAYAIDSQWLHEKDFFT